MRRGVFLLLSLGMGSCSPVCQSPLSGGSSLELPSPAPELTKNSPVAETDQAGYGQKPSGRLQYSELYRIKDVEISIKRNIEDTWRLLNKALKLNGLEIQESDRFSRAIKVIYKTKGVLDGLVLFDRPESSAYWLKLEEHGDRTVITAFEAENEDSRDTSKLKDGAPYYSYDNSSRLIEKIYETLKHGADR